MKIKTDWLLLSSAHSSILVKTFHEDSQNVLPLSSFQALFQSQMWMMILEISKDKMLFAFLAFILT